MADNHSFIKEQIVPNKKNKRKKLFHATGTAAICAVVFGVIGSFVFTLSRPYFEALTGDKNTSVSFTEETKAPATPTPTPSATPAPEPVEVKFPELDMERVEEFYSLLSDAAVAFNRSVVTVSSVMKGVDWFDNPSELKDATSGLMIAKTDTSLFLLSAYNRISDASSIQITFSNGTTVEAQLSGYDKETNLAVLSIALTDIPSSIRKNLEPVVLGDSYYAKPGTPVLALGSPNGQVYSMDFGMVSSYSIDRYITDNKLELFYTSMLSAETGEGAIVDLEGKVLGIITHSEDKNTDFCTAIGISRLKPLIEKLVNNESRASLGVIVNDIPSEYKESISIENGIYISTVNNNSPALDAGLKSGDVILQVDDYDITGVTMFNNLISSHRPKDSITLSIYRTSRADDKEMKVTVTLGKR
ncbi:MAG: S1C family serine protease [Acetivibrio ethanolgignens]